LHVAFPTFGLRCGLGYADHTLRLRHLITPRSLTHGYVDCRCGWVTVGYVYHVAVHGLPGFLGYGYALVAPRLRVRLDYGYTHTRGLHSLRTRDYTVHTCTFGCTRSLRCHIYRFLPAFPVVRGWFHTAGCTTLHTFTTHTRLRVWFTRGSTGSGCGSHAVTVTHGYLPLHIAGYVCTTRSLRFARLRVG